ncbi:plasminogen-binding N-terminal domain-containing protein [uncultured Campylobacter sp.]|uniref:plasminogen-binding N-terminal domain-containing protein n=1 Tax=uncultured Campylobacter sp. TaxID=218934 RepID=UPI00261024A9|nr:plasminogen-binding N-terminal domain-containing protein [uncultured Campylobacter sp.]
MHFKLVFLCIFSINLYALEPIITTVKDIQGDNFYIDSSVKTVKGASAIVTQNIAGVKTVVARAVVTDINADDIKLSIIQRDILEQSALPKTNTQVKIGDEVHLNFLYDRAMLIAANEINYKEIEQKFNSIYFLHPDILGAYMIREYKLSPDVEDFKLICSNNSLGLIVFGLENSVVFVDCYSFSTLYEEKFDFTNKETQTPFYSRIKGYQKVFFNLFEREVGDYYAYYKELIGYKDEK